MAADPELVTAIKAAGDMVGGGLAFSGGAIGEAGHLITRRHQAYGCSLDECEVVGRKLVVARYHTPAMLDLVEEP